MMLSREQVESGLHLIKHDRDREVMKMRYGVGCEPMTMEAAGCVLGVCRERVRQMQKRAERELKHPRHGIINKGPQGQIKGGK